MPLKERDNLPMLKNDKSMNGLVRNVDAIIKVVSPTDPGLTIIHRLQYRGATLIAFRLVPTEGIKV